MTLLSNAKGTISISYQAENSECGVSCLAMVMSYFDYHLDVSELRQNMNIGLIGASLNDLIEIAKDCHFDSKVYRCELNDLNNFMTPTILHWEFEHFVVLKSCNKKGIRIIDPSFGERSVSWKEADSKFTGYALSISPAIGFTKKNLQNNKLAHLKAAFSGIKIQSVLFKVFLFSFIYHLLSLALPLGTQKMIDVIGEKYEIGLLQFIFIAFVTLHVLSVLFRYLRDFTLIEIDFKWGKKLKEHSISQLLRHSISQLEKRNISDLQNRLNSLGEFQNIVSKNLASLFIDGVGALAAFIFMYQISDSLAMITLLSMLLIYVARKRTLQNYSSTYNEVKEAEAYEESSVLATLRNIKSIKSYGYEERRVKDWQKKYTIYNLKKVQLDKKLLNTEVVSHLIVGVEFIILVFASVNLINENTLTFGAFLGYLGFRQLFTNGFVKLFEIAVKFKDAVIELDRAENILTIPLQSTDKEHLEAFSGKISLVNVGFKHSNEEEFLFKNINLEVCPGDNVAIIGKSGSGKSTLLKIISGLIEPTEGQVLYDGLDIRNISEQSKSALISHYLQDESLLPGSIEENITFFDESPNSDLVQSVMELACIKDEVNNLPLGIATIVGDIGHALSGGQQQRVLIARAMYQLPQLFLLDEITSSLDKETEEKIVEALFTGFNARTKIIISHSPLLIDKCVKVIDLN